MARLKLLSILSTPDGTTQRNCFAISTVSLKSLLRERPGSNSPNFTAALAGDTEIERQRQALLFPLYQVKWCCILLNEFVATAGERRRFAEQQPADLASQLENAKRMASQISSRHAPP